MSNNKQSSIQLSMKELIKKWHIELDYHKKKIEEHKTRNEYEECVKHSHYFAQLNICIVDAELYYNNTFKSE